MNKCLSEALSAFQPMADAGAVNHLFESDNVLKLSDALLQLSSLHTPEGPIGVDCGVSADVEDSVGVAPDAATSPPAVDTMDLPRGLGAAQVHTTITLSFLVYTQSNLAISETAGAIY